MILYKYLAPGRLEILDGEMIRFTHPSALNDLSELRPAFGRFFTKDYVLERLDLENLADEAFKGLPEEVRNKTSIEDLKKLALSDECRRAIDIPVSMLNSFATRMRGEIYKSFDQRIGVLSLSESWDNGPMWAHYADAHSGFVIGLDGANRYFNRRRSEKDEFYHLRQVLYADPSFGTRSFSDLSDGTKIFLTKDKLWSYEREWRMLAPLSDATTGKVLPSGDTVHLFPFPGEIIKSIIIGVRAADEFKARLASLINNKSSFAHIKVLQAQLDDDSGRFILLPMT